MKNNLTKYRELSQLSMRQLALKAGMSAMQISRLESGENQFTQKNLAKLSQALNIKPEDLIKENSTDISTKEDNIMLPLYDYKLSAGVGTWSFESISKDDYIMVPVSRETLRETTLTSEKNLNLLYIDGDSMEPLLPNKSLAIVDITVHDLSIHGGIYAFEYDNIPFVKRIQRLPENKLLAIPENKQYRDIEIDLNKNLPLKILGKVIGVLPILKV